MNKSILVVKPSMNHHFGYKLVRQLNIKYHASNITVLDDNSIEYGCKKIKQYDGEEFDTVIHLDLNMRKKDQAINQNLKNLEQALKIKTQNFVIPL